MISAIEKSVDLYKDHFFCHTCGTKRREIKLIQIIGSFASEKELESSPCNSFLICERCYIKIEDTEENVSKILLNTLLFLKSIKYKMTSKDLDFYLKYKKYYEQNFVGNF